jgi:hypothetical protein
MIRAVSVAIFEDRVWQMSWGERAAIEGVLSQLAPRLAVEIGSMEGACLRRLAAHAEEVHSFDLAAPTLALPANVTLHTGDSHELLPGFLSELEHAGRNVDLVIVDGDHTPAGVRRDVEDLLDSPAVANTVLLIHDTGNERVRSGLDAVPFAAWPKVAHVELDWVPGRLFAEPDLRHQLWFGLGLVIVDAARLAYAAGDVFEQRYEPSAMVMALGRDLLLAGGSGGATPLAREEQMSLLRRRTAGGAGAGLGREAEMLEELATLRDRLAGAERALTNIKGSASWKMTEPLRAAKTRAARRFKA